LHACVHGMDRAHGYVKESTVPLGTSTPSMSSVLAATRAVRWDGSHDFPCYESQGKILYFDTLLKVIAYTAQLSHWRSFGSRDEGCLGIRESVPKLI
jgi:hypothetical protein